MSSVNKVILIGNLGKDPEVRYMPSGEPVANITIATSSKYKNKAGELVEETEWHRVSFFGKLAEIVGQYLKKGRPVYVEGRLKTRKYTDKDGVEKYTTDIVANEMQMLGSPDRQDSGGQDNNQGYQEQPQRQAAPQQSNRQAAPQQSQQGNRPPAPQQGNRPPAPQQRPAQQPQGNYTRQQPAAPSGFSDMDDDIPF